MMTTRHVSSVLLAAAIAGLAAAPASAHAQLTVQPRLETAECPIPPGPWATAVRIECHRLVVPEQHSRPGGRTIRLAVAVIHPPSPGGAPPMVLLSGGPGQSGLATDMPMGAAVALFGRHDVVVYDQRGAGFSEPDLCPEYAAVEDSARTLRDPLQREDVWNAGAHACVASLEAKGIDPAAYNTRESALDLADLRTALGYARWDLWGLSYGTRLAQEAMVRDSAGIRTVILAWPVTRSPTTFAEVPLSKQRALDRIIAACDRDGGCRTAFPDLQSDFNHAYEQLTAAPMAVARAEATGTGQDSLWLDGRRLTNRLVQGVRGRREQVPLLIHELSSGDRPRAARSLTRLLADSSVKAPGTPIQVLVHLINCYDSYGGAFRVLRDSIAALVRPPFRSDDYEDCPLWQARHAEPSDQQPVHSDIPTLLLTSEFDEITPTAHGRQIAASLGHAYLFEFPGVGHGNVPPGLAAGACRRSIIEQFLREPSRSPDGSCLDNLPTPRFRTRW
jgi:pimeloyl-ACP methyl ester carboxylesterase